MSPHAEIPIKVNAWVDRGVAPLVEALNDFDELLTLDSCESRDGGAYVLFSVRGDSRIAAAFASDLGEHLASSAPSCLLQAEWRAGSEEPLLALSCSPDSVGDLAEAVNCAHKTLSGDGN